MGKVNWMSFLALIFNLKVSSPTVGSVSASQPLGFQLMSPSHPLTLCLDLLALLPMVFHHAKGSCAVIQSSSSLGNTPPPPLPATESLFPFTSLLKDFPTLEMKDGTWHFPLS